MPSKRTTGTLLVVCTAALAAGALTLGQATSGPIAGPATAPTTTQAAATTQSFDADVAALIHKLGADDAATRDDAQQQLVELGSTVTDQLQRAVDQDEDPEVRNRSAAALSQIKDRDANGPTLITLHAKDADLTSILAQIGKQAHAEITQYPYAGLVARNGPRATLTVDADRRPFWDVMADVCALANVCPRMTDASSRASLQLIPTSRNWIAKGPHQMVGAFCVGVSGVERLSSIDLSGPPMPYDWFTARLVVFPEPKLMVTQISPLAVREAVDDAGNSLVMPATQGLAMRMLTRVTAGRLPVRTVDARLKYPADHPGKKIVTLAGDLTVTLAQGSTRFEADDVMGHPVVVRSLPGAKVRVAVAKQVSLNYYAVTVECSRDTMADAQWYALTNRVGDLSLEDGAGHPMTPPYMWSFDSGNSETTFKATGTFIRTAVGGNLLANRIGAPANPAAPPAPPPPGEPARIVWNVAARFKVVTVPVAFHDLPMP